MSDQHLPNKLSALRTRLRQLGSVVVCYSGGLDSAFLLAVARQELGDRAVAVTADGPSLPSDERRDARRLSKELNVRHEWVDAGEFHLEAYRANGTDRCYYCKRAMFMAAHRVRAELEFACIVDGAHADDEGDYRPGDRAAQEQRVVRPLQETHFTKRDIRQASRDMGLDVWSKPSAACLASRIPYGTPISERVLKQIDGAERELKDLGLGQLRVRYHGPVARIEVEPERVGELLAHRQQVVEAIKRHGFKYVAADLEGYRVGSHNEVLEQGSPSIEAGPTAD